MISHTQRIELMSWLNAYIRTLRGKQGCILELLIILNDTQFDAEERVEIVKEFKKGVL